MKALWIAALFLSTATVAQAGRCVGTTPGYEAYCSAFPVKEACEPRRDVCKWLEMNVLGKLPKQPIVKIK